MLVYLDTCIVIYAVEGQPPFQTRAVHHITLLQAAGHRFAISDLAKCECLVKPLGTSDGSLLLTFEKFFLAPNLKVVPLTDSVYRRAANIRCGFRYAAGNRYSLPDAIDLAAAVESGCEMFLTNDNRLDGFSDLTVVILP
jgi:predicted nucleic acid-binding protein